MQRVKAAPKALLPWLALLSALATVAVNAAANALPLNGLKTGEISDRFAVYFVPAGYVFAVWGLIYVGILAFSVYQLRPAVREDPRLAGVRPWFLASNLANAAWVFLWHYERFPLTLVAMGALLASLVAIHLHLRRGLGPSSPWERWLVDAPFSLYLGWISVATFPRRRGWASPSPWWWPWRGSWPFANGRGCFLPSSFGPSWASACASPTAAS